MPGKAISYAQESVWGEKMAARQGFEPQQTVPETGVLPLDHRAVKLHYRTNVIAVAGTGLDSRTSRREFELEKSFLNPLRANLCCRVNHGGFGAES